MRHLGFFHQRVTVNRIQTQLTSFGRCKEFHRRHNTIRVREYFRDVVRSNTRGLPRFTLSNPTLSHDPRQRNIDPNLGIFQDGATRRFITRRKGRVIPRMLFMLLLNNSNR